MHERGAGSTAQPHPSKSTSSTCFYGKLGRLVQAIDATFEAGAGEEYLARLVVSSEGSASQTRIILKDGRRWRQRK
jgi:hypothetical protein